MPDSDGGFMNGSPPAPGPQHHLILYEHGPARRLPDSVPPDALKRQLRLAWQHRRWLHDYPDPDGSDEADGGSQPFLHFDGSWVQARQYAGIVQAGGTTLYLLPKLFAAGSAPDPVPAAFAHLDYYLSYCRQCAFPFAWRDARPGAGWWQAWAGTFAAFAARVLARQPHHAYQPRTEPTGYLRGKLAVNGYITEHLARGQWQRLQTEHSDFGLDNGFNRIVRYTAACLHALADAAGRTRLHQLAALLPDVELHPQTPADCVATHVSATQPDHRHILDMCRFFLAGMAGTGPGEQPHFSCLLPMERIFEDFVAGFVQRHFPEWEAVCQQPRPLASGPEGRPVSVRPDLLLPHHRMVWDTKYVLPAGGAVPPAAHLYQMLAYATACGLPAAHLLYASASEAASSTCRLAGGVQVHAHALPVTLRDGADTFSALTLRLKGKLHEIAGTQAPTS